MSKIFKSCMFFICLFLLSCENSGNEGLSELVKKVDKILAKQDQIVKSLALLQKDIKSNPAKPQANNKPTADPNKVYNIPIGDSYVKGNKNAPITMIKFTDFQ